MTADTAERVNNSTDVLGHPHIHHDSHPEDPPVSEGDEFDVLAYTMWGDYHVPTVVRWAHGEVDRFDDRDESFENRRRAKQEVDG